jgi:2-amino-4-hydroxy-6-hydroxymethyldihydropteridine diphosphokinase
MAKSATAYIGIGSNLGDREANIDSAVKLIDKTKGLKVIAKSSLYETDPVGGPSQDKYLNGALKLECSLDPHELLKQLHQIEARLGRKRKGLNFPRTIDLDILLFDDVVIDGETLTIPHPRTTERIFVLRPLAEIADETIHPLTGCTIAAHLNNLID